MIGFPPPYAEELLYSTTARAGVHDGETSPKQLLDLVFNNRRVIATVDLPSHVQALADQYPDVLGMNVNTLISRHTHWPIYAPFLPHDRNKKIKRWMSGRSQGAAHLASGRAASRVRSKRRLYVCIECLKSQKAEYGEYFWNRHWQVPLVKTCPSHGPLMGTNIELNGIHRHAYLSVEEATLCGSVNVVAVDGVFSSQVYQLMQSQSAGISFNQWTTFYRQLAINQGYFYRGRIDHAKIHETVLDFWGIRWLVDAGILPTGTEASWLRGIVRKHRKSFSFAEHIVAITALTDGAFSICDAIDLASGFTIGGKKSGQAPPHIALADYLLTQDQINWKQAVKKRPPKLSRKGNPALYMRLYRNNYNWLMNTNRVYRAEKISINKRVDWPKRDWLIARELRRACECLSDDLNAPRLSKSLLIHQLKLKSTVEKNLSRLPRCSKLLATYSESISEYQVRRLTYTYSLMVKSGKEIKRWSLLRQAGLSDERITEVAASFLDNMVSWHA